MEKNISDLQNTGSNLQAWSSLNTVTEFDAGSTVIVRMADNGVALRDANFYEVSLLIESLVGQLCKFMVKNNKRQQKKLYNVICHKLHEMNLIGRTYNVEEFEFKRTQYQRSFLQMLALAKSVVTLGPSDGAILKFPRYKYRPPECTSRYRTEFEELEFIARGGFGKVYKARNKLDGMNYAIKKICLKYDNLDIFMHNLLEVKMIAKLNHPNIVSYKAAWLETLVPAPESSRKVETKSSDEESSSIIFASSYHEETSHKETVCQTKEVSEARALPSLVSPDGSETSVSTVQDSERIEESDTSPESMVCTYQSSSEQVVSMQNTKKIIVCASAMCYMQMQLCERTLRQWLDDRNMIVPCSVDMKQNIRIFEQIVEGVWYIHSQSIVHHDIKPGNIFISADLSQVQVGDFGLACSLNHSPDKVTLLSGYERHGEIGTKLYAAPEQLRGMCDYKSDVYSLGVVLFELLQPFCTDMERCKVITQLRQGNIPPDLTVVAPKWAQLISRLMKPLALRPTANELRRMLKPLVKETAEGTENIDSMQERIQQLLAVISEKEKEMAEKDKIMAEKDKEIAKKNKEIEDLQRRLRDKGTCSPRKQ